MEAKKSTQNIIDMYRFKLSDYASSRRVILLWLQTALIVLLAATLLLVCLVNSNQRLALYAALVGSLLATLIIGYISNIRGKYPPAALLTTICMVVGPWCAILLDPSILGNGDFVPMVYITLSIQMCSIFLSAGATIVIAAVQFAALVLTIMFHPALMKINWPSLLFFVLFTATLGIIYSVVMRKYIYQIEKQKRQLQEKGEELHELSVRDALTGLFNRRYMEETLEREIRNAARKSRHIALIMADINGFKQINDRYGHAMGDYVLRDIAKVLYIKIRSSDTACRYGGDEFVLILNECSHEEALNRVSAINEIISCMEFNYDGKSLKNVSLTYGVGAFPKDAFTSEGLLKAADIAFYKKKRSK